MAPSGKVRFLAILCVLATLPPPPRAEACSCAGVTPLQSLGYSEVAFVGTVISSEEPVRRFTVEADGDTIWSWSSGDMMRYRIVASRGWKGEPCDTFSIYSAQGGASCGYGFEVGETYLVYAYFWREEWGPGTGWPAGTTFPALTTDLCIGTKPLAWAAGSLAVLGPPDWTLDPAPASMRLHQNRPNPFNPVTEIAFELPRHAYASIRVFDVTGRLVRTLLDRDMPAGSFTRAWDGRDELGRPAKSGVYFYELSAGPLRERRRMTLVR